MDFECGVHFIDADKKIPFRTPSKEEWDQHIATLPHEHRGYGSCKDCGASNIFHQVTMTLQPRQAPPVYCDECKERLKKELLGNE